MSEQARYSEHVYQEYACGMHVEPIHQRESIVRCVDCENATNNGNGCWLFSRVRLTGDYIWKTVPAKVEPDGFCKWGKPKEKKNELECVVYD